jgi:hypothetical protein
MKHLISFPDGLEWLLLLVLLLPLTALVDILRSNFSKAENKIIWVLIVIFLPLLGSILYFIMGRNQKATI